MKSLIKKSLIIKVKKEDQLITRGIEVGHIFYFGDKYSKPMKALVNSSSGKNITVEMGSYGIGVSRLVGAIIEANYNNNVMKWPKSVTPFHVAIINLGKKNDEQSKNKAEKIYEFLKENAFDVILDDTDESPASKFKNFDLIGIPYQIIIGSQQELEKFEFKELGCEKEILSKTRYFKKIKNYLFQLINSSELLIIKRYLKPKRKEGILKVISLFSFLGIGLGVATLIIVMSVMNGFRTDLIGKLLLFQPHVLVYQFDNYEETKQNIQKNLKLNKIQISKINLSYQIQALVISKQINKGTVIRALEKKEFLSDKLISQNILEGNIDNFGKSYVSIGSNLSESLGVWVGDKITVLSTIQESTPFGNVPKQFSFLVGSIFKTGIYEFDNNYILIDINSSEEFLFKQNDNRNIEIRLNKCRSCKPS